MALTWGSRGDTPTAVPVPPPRTPNGSQAPSEAPRPQDAQGTRRRARPREHPDDVPRTPTSLTRSGREAGAWVYIDAWTLRTALEAAQIPASTPIRELEATRHVLGDRRRTAQVLLKIRRNPRWSA